ncbi:MAG: hypothetical protein ACREJ0_05495 [Geminicoccaceae bacterium]
MSELSDKRVAKDPAALHPTHQLERAFLGVHRSRWTDTTPPILLSCSTIVSSRTFGSSAYTDVGLGHDPRQNAGIARDGEQMAVVEIILVVHAVNPADADILGAAALLQADIDDIGVHVASI